MANRSYLYAYSEKTPPEIKDLSEWNWRIPLSHLILVSGNPQLHGSLLWDNEEPLAIRGDAAAGFDLLKRFLLFLKTQNLPEPELLATEIDETIAFLERPDNQKNFFWLEAGEVFDLMTSENYGIGSLAKDTIDEVEYTKEEVIKILADPASFQSTKHYAIEKVKEDWQKYLGLYWANVLYFHFK